MEGEKKTMNTGLWLECAGPLVTLPTVGSHVVYFPQGHSEQVIASTQRDGEAEIPNYPNLPAHLICQLHNITLHADPETDEVYAQMTLQPVQHEKEPYLTHDLGIQSKQPTLSFCKTLTASDTSTHGGFSIPRRAAEKVFPPLDFTKQPPAQELVARDLHNHEWPFRHIYRGQPKRHLLTTGWSVFVSSKRLQAGDTVLFMRDENNQLLLGIRRANRQQANVPSSLLSSDSMLIGVLAAAAHAAATNSRFTIYYNPRASYSEFVVPFCRFSKATYHPRVTVGMRFRMELETEDSSTRRYMGTITGIGDLDPGRWPNSLWRTLKVGWDESTAGQRQKRVSLWEIEPLTAPYFPCASSLFLRKRPRLDGDIDDLESMSRSQVWARGEDGKMDIRTLNAAGLSSIDHWLRLQQKPEIISSASSQPDYFRALAAQALQEIRTVDSTKQQLLHQQQIPPVIQMQYRQSQFSQQQQLQAHQNHLQQQQQQMLQQQHQHQQQHQQLQQQQQQHQQHQQQHQQHQHQQHHQQQHQQQQEHQQHQQQHQQQQRHQQQHQNHQLQLPGSTCSMLQQPSHGSQPGHLMSSASRVPSGFSESDLGGFSGIPGNSISLQSLLNRPSSDSLIQDNSPQYSNGSLRSNQVPLQQQQQQHNMPSMLAPPGLLAQEPQLSGSWMSSIRDSNSNAQHVLSPRALESSGNPFMLRVDPPVPAATGSQASLGPLTLQQAPYVYRDAPHQEQESVQSDPRSSHLLFGVNIDSPLVLSSTPGAFPAGGLEKSKDIQFSMLGGSCSPSGSDMHISGGVPPVDDNSPSNWQQQQQQQVQPSPVRTFTKVYKTGSVGRSIDVTRLKNYDELRREIARMFGLEGQLHVDPSRSSWQLVFVDNEGDVLLVGDDPWEEFVTCVRFIKILSPSEVLQMNREGIESLAALPSQRQTSSSSEDCAMQQDNNTNTHNYAQDPRMAYHRQDF